MAPDLLISAAWSSVPGHGHTFDQPRAGLYAAGYVAVAADGDQLPEHVAQIGGDCDLFDRIADLATSTQKPAALRE